MRKFDTDFLELFPAFAFIFLGFHASNQKRIPAQSGLNLKYRSNKQIINK